MWHLFHSLPHHLSPSCSFLCHCLSFCAGEVLLMPTLALQSLPSLSSSPLLFWETFFWRVLCWLTVRNERNSRALGEPFPKSPPPTPRFPARIIAAATQARVLAWNWPRCLCSRAIDGENSLLGKTEIFQDFYEGSFFSVVVIHRIKMFEESESQGSLRSFFPYKFKPGCEHTGAIDLVIQSCEGLRCNEF